MNRKSYIKDKVLIITMHLAVAEKNQFYLAERGVKVIFAARSEDKLNNLSNRICKDGGTASY